MGVPYNGREMTAHPQYLTVRNGRGRDMLDAVAGRLTLLPTQSSGSRRVHACDAGLFQAWLCPCLGIIYMLGTCF